MFSTNTPLFPKSKLFIPTTNCGKAHTADIFGVSISNPYTVTCSGDGTIKLWKNKLLEGDLPKNNVISKFVSKTGVHHVDVFHSVERGGVEICIVACVSFSGNIQFYSVNTTNGELTELDLMGPEDKRKSFWCVKWYRSSDHLLSHRLIATEVTGSTRVWKFHPFAQEIDETRVDKREDYSIEEEKLQQQNEELEFQPHLTLQGEILSSEPNFATSVDVSSNGLIATGFSDGSVVVAQLRTLRPIYNFEGFGIQGIEENSSTVRDVKFSPLGGLLAVANDSGSYGCVTLYETEYGERVGNLTVPTHSAQTSVGSFAHDGWVFSLSFNSTGEFLASCGYDSKVRVWDVKLKERVSTLNISAGDIEIEEDILLKDEQGNSLKNPPVMAVTFINKGVRGGMGSDTNEGLCCVCLDRSVRWFREAGGV